MRYHHEPRPGKTLVLFALLLPVLAGMVGLVIDTGLLLAAHRQLQNAADAAALCAAMDQLRGQSFACASGNASNLLQTQYGLPADAIDVHSPPTQGAYAGNVNCVEAILTQTTATYFMSALGSYLTTTRARAVAGVERRTVPWTVLALDPNAVPGLALAGAVQINGTVLVCSQGAGSDQNGGSINLGLSTYAISTGGTGQLQSAGVRSAGGVDFPANVGLYPGASGVALNVTGRISSDPFLYLPSPTTATGVLARYPDVNGTLQSAPQDVALTVDDASAHTLLPGIYSSIAITGTGTGTVTFQPGIYVLKGGQDPALRIATTATIVGTGVLFYNTASDYAAATGLPDALDGNLRPSSPATGTNQGGISIQAGSLTLSGLSDPTGPFDGLLLYQRRANTSTVSIQGVAKADSLQGTLYARWAKLTLAGPCTCQAQLIAGNLAITAPATGSDLTIGLGSVLAGARQVYLVE